MKRLNLILPLIAMVLLFSAGTAMAEHVKEKAVTEQAVMVKTLKLEQKEAYKIEDAEYKGVVATPFSLNGIEYAGATAGVAGFLVMFMSLFKRLSWGTVCLFVVAGAVVTTMLLLPGEANSTQTFHADMIPALGLISTQLSELKEARGKKLKEMDDLVNLSVTEKRSFKTEEETKYNTLRTEIEDIDKRLKVLTDAQERSRKQESPLYVNNGGNNDQGDTQAQERRKLISKFSFKRALKMGVARGTVRDGVEEELNQEERRQMVAAGVSELNSESILIPADALSKEKRDMTATGSSGAEGGYSIQQNVQGLVDVLLPEMVLAKLPILRLNGLVGNVRFPKATTQPSAGWNTENGTATEKSPAMDKLDLSPKRLAAFIQLSNQLLNQSEANIREYANRFLINAQAIEFEKAALKGGGSNEPTGIIGGSGTQAVYAGGAASNGTNANGAAAVWADIVNLVKKARMANSINGQAYITSPQVVGKLQVTPRQGSGVEGNFIMPTWNGGANGFPVLSTSNMLDTYTKGTATGVLSAMIFGDFSKFVMASWGGLEIGVDPYTNMKEGMTNIVLNSYVDCGMLNPEAFSVVKDLDAR